ncbi:diguanylate cyclase domain protein [Acinetobacter sp. 263903-1]|uniref:putative bifunctional diguanylate cyclase/phosphodiesterase n=1 Tax=Acinetobacter sp. 263903-1 TaxID=1310678 RepID=UPI00049F8A44|nr:EAL domain-containing protein [Acinetobacter sp. 263903-1]KCX38170.1 diguanylate cyclase domain protein [Acinetobacter sp. 263903-1]
MVHMHYNSILVLGSVLVAVAVCYIAISLREFLIQNTFPKYHNVVLAGSGLFLGLAICSMHFAGLLAVHLSQESVFDPALTIVSYLVASAASIFALWLTSREFLSLPRLVLAAVVMGLGISGMHYTGMMGLILHGYMIYYQLLLVILSVLVGILGTGLSFWLAFKYQHATKYRFWIKLGVALVFALSISSVHYIAMAGVVFYTGGQIEVLEHYQAGRTLLLFTIVFITCLVLMTAFLVAILEERLEERNRRLMEINKELANLAVQDNLTRLPNRLFLLDYAQYLFIEHKINKKSFAFLYIDLDRFKAVNDAFGHQVGDQLLIQVAARIHQNLGPEAKLLRVGGDEFLLIIENTGRKRAIYYAEKVLSLIQASYLIAGKEINISCSIGIAIYPEHGTNLQDLLINADAAMLTSKYQGRNTYSVFNFSTDQHESKSQSKLINDLYKAVEEQQFILVYQPKFTHDEQICGVEALIRWKHPLHGLLGPNMFIPGAEKTGLIIPMGYWALEQACKQIQLWEADHADFFPIGVNLSAIQFEHKHLISTLEQLLNQYKIDPQHLMIEITESTAMHHIDSSIRALQQLRQMGIQLAIDDFGTGHSSFLYLKNLPVDELKIDKEFIQGLSAGSKEEMILESIIQLAIKLGLKVTAEGIETVQQAEILTRLGCQQMQGYLLGKPMDVEQLEARTFVS